MADYTYQELIRMQNDAIKRAEDMQARARKSAGLEENDLTKKKNVPAQEPKRIQMPKGYLDIGTEREKSQEQPKETQNDFFEKIKNGAGEIDIDSDKALLLSLIMLLSEENADELLIMALIYMLS